MLYLRARFERHRRRLTLKDAAKLTKLTSTELSLIERGRLVPTEAQLGKMTAAYGVAANELLKQVESVENAPTSETTA